MRLSGQMQHMSDGVPLDHAQHSMLVPQVHFFENVLLIPLDAFKVRQMPGVRKAIEIHQPRNFGPVNDVLDQI